MTASSPTRIVLSPRPRTISPGPSIQSVLRPSRRLVVGRGCGFGIEVGQIDLAELAVERGEPGGRPEQVAERLRPGDFQELDGLPGHPGVTRGGEDLQERAEQVVGVSDVVEGLAVSSPRAGREGGQGAVQRLPGLVASPLATRGDGGEVVVGRRRRREHEFRPGPLGPDGFPGDLGIEQAAEELRPERRLGHADLVAEDVQLLAGPGPLPGETERLEQGGPLASVGGLGFELQAQVFDGGPEPSGVQHVLGGHHVPRFEAGPPIRLRSRGLPPGRDRSEVRGVSRGACFQNKNGDSAANPQESRSKSPIAADGPEFVRIVKRGPWRICRRSGPSKQR